MKQDEKKGGMNPLSAFGFNMKNGKDVISKMAKSGDAQRLMELLNQDGNVQDAAKSAAKGDTSQLMGMVQRLMQSDEGAKLVDQISQEAKKSGLE